MMVQNRHPHTNKGGIRVACACHDTIKGCSLFKNVSCLRNLEMKIVISLAKMLLLFCLSSSFISSVFALPQELGVDGVPLGFCRDAIRPSSQPGLYNVVYDTDPNFVYNPANCTSTDQQILPSPEWAVDECLPAIEAVCGSTGVRPGVAGKWTWAWHGTNGVTCQAGLYQDINVNGAPNGGRGFLDDFCCLQNFRAMQTSLTVSVTTPGSDPAYNARNGNRLSVNIAPGGFPFTESSDKFGTLVNVKGSQMTPGYPSYILQGYEDIPISNGHSTLSADYGFDIALAHLILSNHDIARKTILSEIVLND